MIILLTSLRLGTYQFLSHARHLAEEAELSPSEQSSRSSFGEFFRLLVSAKVHRYLCLPRLHQHYLHLHFRHRKCRIDVRVLHNEMLATLLEADCYILCPKMLMRTF